MATTCGRRWAIIASKTENSFHVVIFQRSGIIELIRSRSLSILNKTLLGPMRSSLRPKQVNIFILKKNGFNAKSWPHQEKRKHYNLKCRQLRSSSKGKMGKSAMKILGMKDEEFYEVGPLVSICLTCTLYNWHTVPLMEDSLIGLNWWWHSQGMGKYFVTLAKQVGYERTILLLGRHLRFQSIGIRVLTIATTKSIRQFFFSKWQKQLLQHFSSIFHNKCSPQRLLPEPRQSPWLLEVHIPKGETKKKR